jgi:predicted DNA-binding transcriptional regulator YafY
MASSPKERLMALLNAGRELTLDALSRHLDVSRRHVRRLLKSLREDGREVQERWEEGQKRFSLAPEDRSVPVQHVELRERELQALTVAASAAQATLHPTPFDDHLGTAVRKLLETAGVVLSFEPDWQPEVWHFDDSVASNVDAEVFWGVVRAANACETVAIDYYSASSGRRSTGRRVNPLVIAEQGGSWLVAAYCHQKQQVLDFSLPAIETAEPTGEYFTRPDSFDRESYFGDRFHALRGTRTREVQLHVAADKAEYFQRKTYHPSQEITDQEDGAIRATFHVSSLDDMAAFVRSWGPGVRVLRPDELAERIQADAKAMLEAYSDES